MATKEQVENWIIEYALRKNYHDVVRALLQQNHEAVYAPNMEIRLVMCTLNKIVSQEDISQFSLAANIVDFISRSVGKFCSVKLYGKIIYMLKMKMLLQHLQKDTLYVLVLLNKNLPRSGLQFDNVNMKELKKLNERISSFRKFFLTLVANESTKQSYFADEYEEEFGEDFMLGLKQFVQIFIDKINSYLPKTMLEQIFDRRDLLMKHHPTSVAMEILLDCIYDKTSLSAGELYDFWHLLNPDQGNIKVKTKTCLTKRGRLSNIECLDDEKLLTPIKFSKSNPVTQSVPYSSKSNIVYSVIDLRQSLRKSNISEGCSNQPVEDACESVKQMTSECNDNLTARHSLHQFKVKTPSTTAESLHMTTLSDTARLFHMKQKCTESQGTDIRNKDVNISSGLDRNQKKGKYELDRNAESARTSCENQIESKKREMRDKYTCQRKSLVSSDQNEPEKKMLRKNIILEQQSIYQISDSELQSTRAIVSKTDVTGSYGLTKKADKETSEDSYQSSHEGTCIWRRGQIDKSRSNETFISMTRKIDGTFSAENQKSEETLVSRQPKKQKFQKFAKGESAQISFDSDRMKEKRSINLDQCVTSDEESSAYSEEVIVSSGILEPSDSMSQSLIATRFPPPTFALMSCSHGLSPKRKVFCMLDMTKELDWDHVLSNSGPPITNWRREYLTWTENFTSRKRNCDREEVVVLQSSENTPEQVYIISSSSDSHPDSSGSHPALLDAQQFQSEEKQEEDCLNPNRSHMINSSESIIPPSPDINRSAATPGETDMEDPDLSALTAEEIAKLLTVEGLNESLKDIDSLEGQSEFKEDRQEYRNDPSSGDSLCSIFQVYQIHSDDDDDDNSDYSDSSSVVPPSTIEDVELWDLGEPIFDENYNRPERENLPELKMHLKNERIKLCVVKLYKKQDLVCMDSISGQQLDIYM